MKSTNAIFIATALAALVLLAGPTATASDWGCECVLCMSNPGGATQYKECEPPIEKLKKHLSHGGKFPGCKEAQGYGMQTGRESYYSCQEAYGREYEAYQPQRDIEAPCYRRSSSLNGYNDCTQCRKFEGYRDKKICYGDGINDCKIVRAAKYTVKPVQKRTKRNYIQLKKPDGQTGDRVWYNPPKRKKRGLF